MHMKKAANVLMGIAVLLVIAGSVFCYQGFDKKNNYHNSDYSSLAKVILVLNNTA